MRANTLERYVTKCYFIFLYVISVFVRYKMLNIPTGETNNEYRKYKFKKFCFVSFKLSSRN